MSLGYSEKKDVKTTTAKKIKFSAKDFFSKCDKIPSFLQIWPYY